MAAGRAGPYWPGGWQWVWLWLWVWVQLAPAPTAAGGAPVMLIAGDVWWVTPAVRAALQQTLPGLAVVLDETQQVGRCCGNASVTPAPPLPPATRFLVLGVLRAVTAGDVVAQARLLAALSQFQAATHYVLITKALAPTPAAMEAATAEYALQFAAQHRKVAVWLRFHELFGLRRQPPETLLDRTVRDVLAQQPPPVALDDVFWDFVHVRDAAQAVGLAVAQPSSAGPLDVGTGQGTSLALLRWVVADLANKCLGRPLPRPSPPPSVPRRAAVVANLSRPSPSSWTWRAEVTLWPGVSETVLHTAKRGGLSPGANASCLREEAGRMDMRWTGAPLAAQLGHGLHCPQPTQFPEAATERVSELQHTTLVAVIGLLRSPGVTWLNFRHHVLNPKVLGGPVDLALAVSQTSSGDVPVATDFHTAAKYVWEVRDPPENNYRHYLNEVAWACYRRRFTARDASALGRRLPGNFLGMVAEARHEYGGGAALFFRWLLLHQLTALGLLARYRYLVVTRSDLLCVRPHPPLRALRRREVLVPRGQDYHGVNDRHMALRTTDAPTLLNILDCIIRQPGKRVAAVLKEEGYGPSGRLGYNIEGLLAWWLALHNFTVTRFRAMQFIVLDRQPPGEERLHSKPLVPRVTKILVLPKYPSEYEEAVG